MSRDAYVPPRGLLSGHAQTILPALRRRPAVRLRRERRATPDGDFIDVDWLDAGAAADAPLVVLFHGLEGSSRSHYARSLMMALERAGWRGAIPHFRGCSGELNRLPRAYHSGDHEEIGWMLQSLRGADSHAVMFAVGVSLGGSALLNWLGRAGAAGRQWLRAAAAVSTPLDLAAAGVAIGQGFNRIYTRYFLRTLLPKALAMARLHPALLDPVRIGRARTMYAFDDAVTAPLHGFASADDYWSRASAKPWLSRIALPTLVLNARNDPFVPAASLPSASEVGPWVTLETPAHGGHAGFPGRDPVVDGKVAWLPARVLRFFEQALRAPVDSAPHRV